METTKLKNMDACREAVEYVKAQKSVFFAWENCERGDWMRKYLLPKIKITDNLQDCWNWLATKSNGYGMIRFNGEMQKATRVIWELTFGKIKGGVHVLHHCDNPSCVNPSHLFLGTHQDNMTDKKDKGRVNYGSNGYIQKTHCPQGHPYSGENLIIYKNMRYCKICSSIYKNNYKRKAHEKCL